MVEKAAWGELDATPVHLFTLSNKNGMLVKLSDYGATTIEVRVPDRDGNLSDITHGFDDLAGYRSDGNPYFGATVGRVANRIKNARFELEGKSYKLAANAGAHSLHGGIIGWDKVVWKAEILEDKNAVKFTHTSPDGDEGFPGTVKVTTVYSLTDDNEFTIEMSAETDQTTPVNMVHHSYWNLAGSGSDSNQEQLIRINADKYTPGDADLVPTGEEAPVAGTVFDFREPKAIGKDLLAVGGDPIGYDHNFIINGPPNELRTCAVVEDPKSGRVMELQANQPGMQFYSGNFMDGSTQGRGRVHKQYSAFCLESQSHPNAINQPEWQSQVVLRPGERYHHVMVHKFSTK